MKLSMKIRAHEAELLVVGTEEEQTAEITRIMLPAGLHGRGAEQASGRGAKKTLCRGSGPARHHDAPQVSMVLATVSSASREAVRCESHRTGAPALTTAELPSISSLRDLAGGTM